MDRKCLFAMLLVLATVAPLKVTAHNRLEKGLLKMIDNWNNNNYWRIPIDVPRSPIKMPGAHLNENGYKFSSSEIRIYLDEISVQSLKAQPSTYRTYIEFEIPSVQGFADWYHLENGLVDNEGKFSFKIEALKMWARVDFGPRGSDTEIVYFDMSYGYRTVKVYLSGAWGIVESMVNDEIRKMLREKERYIVERVKNEVVNRTISFLRGHSPEQLVQLISSD